MTFFKNVFNYSPFLWSGLDQIHKCINLIILTSLHLKIQRFIRWDGDTVSVNPKITVSINGDKKITAAIKKYQPDPNENAIINEISYRALKTEDSEDWIELNNNGSQYIDLSGRILTDLESDHGFVIPGNNLLGPGEYLVISRDKNKFSDVYPLVFNVI